MTRRALDVTNNRPEAVDMFVADFRDYLKTADLVADYLAAYLRQTSGKYPTGKETLKRYQRARCALAGWDLSGVECNHKGGT